MNYFLKTQTTYITPLPHPPNPRYNTTHMYKPFITLSYLAVVTLVSTLTATAQVTPLSTSPTFTFKQATQSVVEGNTVRITVVAPSNLTKTTRVTYTVTPQGGAVLNRDYTVPRTRSLVFYKGGLTEKSIPIRTITDSLVENESLLVRLTGTVRAEMRVSILDKVGMAAATSTSTAAGKTPWYTCPALNVDNTIKMHGFTLALADGRVRGPSTFGIAPPDARLFRGENGDIGRGGTAFPGWPSNTQSRWRANVGEYTSVKFTVPEDLPLEYSWTWIFGPRGDSGSAVAWSISECQGDFRTWLHKKAIVQYPELAKDAPENLRYPSKNISCGGVTYAFGGMNVDMDSFATYPTKPGDFPAHKTDFCPVIPGKTYYFNYTLGPIALSANGIDLETGVITQNDSGPVSSEEDVYRFFTHPENILRTGSANLTRASNQFPHGIGTMNGHILFKEINFDRGIGKPSNPKWEAWKARYNFAIPGYGECVKGILPNQETRNTCARELNLPTTLYPFE